MMNGASIRIFLGTTVLTAFLMATPFNLWAWEDDSGGTVSFFIQHFDKDGDGLVFTDEFPGDEERFNRLDMDGNGYIDEAEAPQGPPRGGRAPEDMLSELDVDGDGHLSPEEFPGPEGIFGRLDSDEDGFVSLQELIEGGPGQRGNGGFERDDTNGDGMVSSDEFGGPEELFYQLDSDGDGYIKREEVRPRFHHR